MKAIFTCNKSVHDAGCSVGPTLISRGYTTLIAKALNDGYLRYHPSTNRVIVTYPHGFGWLVTEFEKEKHALNWLTLSKNTALKLWGRWHANSSSIRHT